MSGTTPENLKGLSLKTWLWAASKTVTFFFLGRPVCTNDPHYISYKQCLSCHFECYSFQVYCLLNRLSPSFCQWYFWKQSFWEFKENPPLVWAVPLTAWPMVLFLGWTRKNCFLIPLSTPLSLCTDFSTSTFIDITHINVSSLSYANVVYFNSTNLIIYHWIMFNWYTNRLDTEC